jgi:hypothetical protein
MTPRDLSSLKLGKVLIQPDPGPFTRPVGCARLTQRTDECFRVSIELSQPLDSIRESPACSRVLIQECLSV